MLGVETDAVKRFVPSVPVRVSAGKVAIPDSAFLIAVPERTAFEAVRLT